MKYPICYNCMIADGHCKKFCQNCGGPIVIDDVTSEFVQSCLNLSDYSMLFRTCNLNPHFDFWNANNKQKETDNFSLCFTWYDGNINWKKTWCTYNEFKNYLLVDNFLENFKNTDRRYEPTMSLGGLILFKNHKTTTKPVNSYIWNFMKEPEKWYLN